MIGEVKENEGYKMGNQNITIICYADKVIITNSEEDNSQRLLHQFNITTKQKNNE